MHNKILFKTNLCRNFKDEIQDSCKYGDKCLFAHDERDIKKIKCLFELNCYKGSKEHINVYYHPENWNYKSNKNTALCKEYIKGKCLKDEDCLFMHKINEINYKNINLDDDFQKLNDIFKSKVIINDKKFSECLKFNSNEDKDIKLNYEEENNNKDWADDDPHNEDLTFLNQFPNIEININTEINGKHLDNIEGIDRYLYSMKDLIKHIEENKDKYKLIKDINMDLFWKNKISDLEFIKEIFKN